MPRNPRPVHPRVFDAREYETALRRAFLDPMFRRLQSKLAVAESANQAFRAMDEVVEAQIALPEHGIPTAKIQSNLNRMAGYHRKRVISSFRAALGVNVATVLSEPEIARFMTRRVAENVDLIRTIPGRMHAGIKRKLERELETNPFDQSRLKKIFRDEYGSSGYNLRRIVRDQTSKTIGGLTEIRQTQLGVERYQWLTSQDERVRATHVANSGLMFAWTAPPTATGHPGQDVMCRCVAIAVVTQASYDRLRGEGPYSITGIAA